VTRIGKSRGLIGVGLFVCLPTLAQAAPKAAPAASSAPSTATSAAFPAPATSAAPVAPAPTPPAPSTTPVAPGATPSAAPTDAATPQAPPADAAAPAAPPPGAAPAAEEEEEAPAPRRKHKKKHRRHHVDEDRDEDEDEDEDEDSDDDDRRAQREERRQRHREGWHARDTTFIVSAERLTTLAYWTVSENEPAQSNGFGGVISGTKRDTSGVDVSFLGNAPLGNVHNIPRLGFDGRLPNGLTLGGSLSYIVSSSDTETADTSSSSSSTSRTFENPTQAVFLMGARIGVLFEASRYVSLWLRGGGTRLSVSADSKIFDNNSGTQTNFTHTETTTLYTINLEPQVVITPIAHVGVTLGVNLDICASGTKKQTSDIPANLPTASNTEEHDLSASSYGASAGLIALF